MPDSSTTAISIESPNSLAFFSEPSRIFLAPSKVNFRWWREMNSRGHLLNFQGFFFLQPNAFSMSRFRAVLHGAFAIYALVQAIFLFKEVRGIVGAEVFFFIVFLAGIVSFFGLYF